MPNLSFKMLAKIGDLPTWLTRTFENENLNRARRTRYGCDLGVLTTAVALLGATDVSKTTVTIDGPIFLLNTTLAASDMNTRRRTFTAYSCWARKAPHAIRWTTTLGA